MTIEQFPSTDTEQPVAVVQGFEESAQSEIVQSLPVEIVDLDHNLDHEVQPIQSDEGDIAATGLQKFLRKRADKHNQGLLVLQNNADEVKTQKIANPDAPMVTNGHYKHRLKTVRKQNRIRTEHSRTQHNLRRSFGNEIADPGYLETVRSEKISIFDRYARKQQKAKIKAHRKYQRSVEMAGDSAKILRNNEEGQQKSVNDDIQNRSKIGKKINKTPLRKTLYSKGIKGAYKLSSTGIRTRTFSGETRRAWNEETARTVIAQASLYEQLAKSAVGEQDIAEIDNSLNGPARLKAVLEINKLKKIVDSISIAESPEAKKEAQAKLDKMTHELFKKHGKKTQRRDSASATARSIQSKQPRRYRAIKRSRKDAKNLIVPREK